jgi:hypothetical protein
VTGHCWIVSEHSSIDDLGLTVGKVVRDTFYDCVHYAWVIICIRAARSWALEYNYNHAFHGRQIRRPR